MKLSKKASERIKNQLQFLLNAGEALVIDADTHATDTAELHPDIARKLNSTPNYYHGRPVSAEDLISEMNMAGVDMALIWQNPAATVYVNDPAKDYEILLKANKYIFESSLKSPNRFIPGGWTDPKALGLDLALKLTEVLVEDFGFAIVKMNPAQNAFPIDSTPVMTVVDKIVELGAVPAFHFGADTIYTPAEGLENIAKRHPQHPVIGVHMGGGGASYPDTEDLCQKARKLGLEYPNIKYALSAKRDTHIESDLITYTLAGEPFACNIFCASDAPYGRMTWNYGGYRAMFDSLIKGSCHTDARVRDNPNLFTPTIAQNFMGNNFTKFIIGRYQHLLKQS